MMKNFSLLLVSVLVAVSAWGQGDFFSLMHAANDGDVDAQVDLGYAYATGNGVTQNYGQAAYWWKKASAKGHADAQYNMGCLYEKGLGVPFDRFKAAKSWRRAADKGHAQAQWRLSVCYTDGEWVTPDPEKASKWSLLAMQSGYTAHLKSGSPTAERREEPVFSRSSFGGSKLPIKTYTMCSERRCGCLVVDWTRSRYDHETRIKKMKDAIEASRNKMNIGLLTGQTAPNGALYRIVSQQVLGDEYTMKVEW